MSGWDVLSALKLSEPTAHRPVIMLTGMQQREIGHALVDHHAPAPQQEDAGERARVLSEDERRRLETNAQDIIEKQSHTRQQLISDQITTIVSGES